MPPGQPGCTCSIIGPGVMDLDAFWAGVPRPPKMQRDRS